MASRLDRLISLLDTGSTPAVRSTAAKQLGQIAALRVRGSSQSQGEYRGLDGEWDEAVQLIARILPFLRSKSWETRSAAGQALEAVCRSSGIWDPSSSAPPADEQPSASALPAPQHKVPLSSFDLVSVLSTGSKLLASTGHEYARPLSRADLAQAKKDAVSKLGLGFLGGEDALGVDMEEELKDETEDGDVKMERGGAVPVKQEEEQVKSEPSPPASLPPPRFLGGKSPTPPLPPPPPPPAAAAAPAGPADEDAEMAGLSARERNRLKRKRKAEGGKSAQPALVSSKVRVMESPSAQPVPAPVKSEPDANADWWKGKGVPGAEVKPKSRKSSTSSPTNPATSAPVVVDPQAKAAVKAAVEAAANSAGGGAVKAHDGDRGASKVLQVKEGEFPFGGVVEVLAVDLLSPAWEVRHGAAVGLREVLKVQGSGGGKAAGLTIAENDARHTAWCEDVATKLLCVFALDRFGDFVSDQVVAPVRETAAQSIASLLLHMPPASVLSVHALLQQMTYQPKEAGGDVARKKGDAGYVWEVRHAGLLGLKYLVAVRKDLLGLGEAQGGDVKMEGDETGAGELLRKVVDAVVLGLSDTDDDVRAVAAATLLPITNALVHNLFSAVPHVIEVLWDCLTELKDDLCSSTSNVMNLLAKLIEFPSVMDLLVNAPEERSLPSLIPRLYPFFRHTIHSVRLAIIHALSAFLAIPSLPTTWLDTPLLRFLFQNLVVEERPDVRSATSSLFYAVLDRLPPNKLPELAFDHLQGWFAIVMTPIGLPIDPAFFLKPTGVYGAGAGGADANGHNVDKNIIAQDLALVSAESILRGRIAAIKALARVLADWPVDTQHVSFSGLIPAYIASPYALQQQLASTLIEEWSLILDARSVVQPPAALGTTNEFARSLASQLIGVLTADPPATYAEMSLVLTHIRAECQALYSAFVADGKVARAKVPALPAEVDPTGAVPDAFSLATAQHVVGAGFDALVPSLGRNVKKAVLPMLLDRQRKAQASIGYYLATKDKHDTQVYAAIASAVIALRVLPPKLNPLIRSIMNSIKGEENVDLQQRSASALSRFVAFCATGEIRANPTDKIVKNLCAFVCQDERQTPLFGQASRMTEGVLTLQLDDQATAAAAAAVAASGKRGAASKEDAQEPEEVIRARLVQRGAQSALGELAKRFGGQLFSAVPKLWECMAGAVSEAFAEAKLGGDDALLEGNKGQDVVDTLTVLQMVAGSVDASLHPNLSSLLPFVSRATRCRYAVVRYAAARCLATLCDVITQDAMRYVVDEVVPYLGDSRVLSNRQGAAEVMHHIVQLLDIKILPYVIFLIVPVLGRMSDSDDNVRRLATNTFASLVKLVPLEAGLPDPPGFSPELFARREDERKFLTQLLDGSKVEEYEIPVKIKADLRKYQREGISWMAFLAKYQLHGILCDDMGLGKTLQSITILASKHHERAERFKATGSPDAAHLPSLIICPPTLTGHWYHEILNYAENVRPLLYTGLPADRTRLRSKIPKHDAVIMSYDVVRNDIADLSRFNWLYCILDEGHIIRNAKTKLTKAIKTIKAHHRLLLSGTPIQNNVLELWSLFDFLMPGFLGTEKSFNDRFAKTIFASRDAKSSSREQEAASLALEALHKQVLPFLLRRLKEDVLHDLPPKIIQDYYCDLSDVQKQLYEEFGKSEAHEQAGELVKAGASSGKSGGGQQHVFQALQYLRKLCNHPALVLKEDVPQHQRALAKLQKAGGSLRDIGNAPKLQALRQLLVDCGIGGSANVSGPDPTDGAGAVSQHRVLIFCQLKQMLDLIETDLFKMHMPSVSYMRLDGQTDPNKRHSIVQTFNADPSIDVLLLTTHVGGLGLNLTGADTVIFVEHDWNPMNDLQAMDRAHRLGQKRTVNVYRLITRGTLEEKIMGLQRFKLNIANSVVTQQNSGLDTMDTGQVLDLFNLSAGGDEPPSKSKKEAGADAGPVGQKNVLEGLEDLPPEQEYESLDVSTFLGTLS